MQWVLLVLCLILLGVTGVQTYLLYRLWRTRPSDGLMRMQLKLQKASERELIALRSAVETSAAATGDHYDRLADSLREEQRTRSAAQEAQMRSFSRETEQSLTAVRISMQQQLQLIRADQERQLEEMRQIVDEKMQRVLSERVQQAFSTVNEQLEQVHKGLGEMQSLAGNVGDLKKLLTNVKTRGEIGEIALGALLRDTLPEGQYVENASIGRGQVEFAVRMPDAAGNEVLLPIDAKFAGDTYRHLQDAYESGDAAAVKDAQRALRSRILGEAKDISAKYILPPVTTDHGILFLPTEGLYTEAVRGGLTEEAYRRYHVFITGPTTLTALLTTLRMGIQSIAVQRYSGEVWRVLGEVRKEFHTYADALAKTQSRLDAASEELEKLVGTRTRAMEKALDNVQDHLEQKWPE
ncbi:MAG: DNA recombination protein RmuC [Oscillospiraceae bacterium]|nr:DNA recombination protein RmuC [Oscillospiraceae bacterium]